MNKKTIRKSTMPSAQTVSAGWRLRLRKELVGVILTAALIVTGIYIRAYHLGNTELWGDEFLYLRMSHPGLTSRQVITEHMRSYSYVGHLPATAILSNIGMRLQGLRTLGDITAFNSRVPSVVMGLLSLAVLSIWILRMTKSPLQALLTLAVATFSFVHVWYSREAYHYVGELLYASLVLLSFQEFTTRGTRTWRSLLTGTLFALCSLALAFCHPSGIALLATIGLYTLIRAILVERRNIRLYAAFVICATLVAAVFLAAGAGQSKINRIPALRDPFWVECYDVLEHLILGPGAWRAILSSILLGVGISAILRERSTGRRAFLLTIPALYLVLRLGGRCFSYHPRYYLLLWPLLLWVTAAGAASIVRAFPLQWRSATLIAAIALLASNVYPGLTMMYTIHGKGRQFESLYKSICEKLAAGTLCVWDQGHACSFIPGFYDPKRFMIFGMLPDHRPEAYASGAVQSVLSSLKENFPLVAHLEYASCVSELPSPRETVPGKTYRDEIGEILPGQWDCHDPDFYRLEKSRWIASDMPLRLSPAFRTWKQNAMVATARLYFTAPALIPDTVWPVFDPAAWQLMLLPNGSSLLAAGTEATVRLDGKPSLGPRNQVQIEVVIVAFTPGTLRYVGAGTPAGGLRFETAHEVQRILLSFTTSDRMWLRFTFAAARGNAVTGQPLFGVLKMRQVQPAAKSNEGDVTAGTATGNAP